MAKADMLNPSASLVDQAYGAGLAARRRVMTWISIVSVLGMAMTLWMSLHSPRFDIVDQAVIAASALIFAVFTIMLRVADTVRLYRIVHAWVWSVVVAMTGLHINALFGSTRGLILDGYVPGYIASGPLIITFIYTYLEHQRAHLIAYLFCGINAVATLAHSLLFWNSASSEVAIVYLILTYLLFNPVTVALMVLHQRIHTQATSALERSYRDARWSQAQAERARKSDPVTGALNRAGLDEQLQLDLVANRQTTVLAIALDREAEIRRELGDRSFDGLLRTLSRLFTDGLGPNSRLARRDGAHFVIWSADLDEADALRVAENVFRRTSTYAFELQTPISFSAGFLHVRGARTPEFVIDQVHFELSQAQTAGGGRLWATARDGRADEAESR